MWEAGNSTTRQCSGEPRSNGAAGRSSRAQRTPGTARSRTYSLEKLGLVGDHIFIVREALAVSSPDKRRRRPGGPCSEHLVLGHRYDGRTRDQPSGEGGDIGGVRRAYLTSSSARRRGADAGASLDELEPRDALVGRARHPDGGKRGTHRAAGLAEAGARGGLHVAGRAGIFAESPLVRIAINNRDQIIFNLPLLFTNNL